VAAGGVLINNPFTPWVNVHARFFNPEEHDNMTIGSTHNHPADLAIEPSLPVQPWARVTPTPLIFALTTAA